MAGFVAMEPEDGNRENTVFVRDGFHFWAFLLPFAWFLWHRMWLEAALAFAASILIGLAVALPPLAAGGGILSLLFQIAVGHEASGLRLWSLRRRGWSESGTVEAASEEEAEIRFFADEPEDVVPQPQPIFGRGPWGREPAFDLFDHTRRPA